MGTSIGALNVSQRIQETAIHRHDVAGYPITLYTVPSGKKAKIYGWVRCDNTGAAANVNFNAGGVTNCKWVNGSVDPNSLSNRAVGVGFFVDIVLLAAQTITWTQNVGANADTTTDLSILELPS